MSFIDRIKQEQTDLQEKIDKLHSFIDGDFMGIDVGKVQATILNKQLIIMMDYNECLLDRLEDLEK